MTLTGVTVSDPLPGLSSLDCDQAQPAAGASMTCTATYTVTEADLVTGVVENNAAVAGDGALGAVSGEGGATTSVVPVSSQPRVGGGQMTGTAPPGWG